MNISIEGADRTFDLGAVVVAGYTGRDRSAVQHHIDELAAIGVPPPSSFPAYWIFPPYLATTASSITLVGGSTSGEAELCLLVSDGAVFVSLASDHTDRDAEAVDIGMSKAICQKPMAREAWPVDAVADRWDALVLRSWIVEDGVEVLYQEGECASLVRPMELLEGVPYRTPSTFALLTGTVPVIGGIRSSQSFRAELYDPVDARSIHLAYTTDVLDTATTTSPPHPPSPQDH